MNEKAGKAMNRVKQLREEKGFKQTDLSDMLGVSQATLSNWERGVHDPDNETLGQLAQIFDCSVDYLLMRSDVRELLDGAYLRIMQDAQDSQISPHDLQLALDFLKQAKDRNDNIGKNSL